jgi:hypothetical protein
MTKQQNDRRNRATSNALRLKAERHRCPNCQRKAAIKSYSDEFSFGSYCRWDDCGYKNITVRDREWDE